MKKVLLVVVLAAAGYLGKCVLVALDTWNALAERRAQYDAIRTLAGRHAASLGAFGDLAGACAGKLTPGPPRTIAVYTLPKPETRARFAPQQLDGVLVETETNGAGYASRVALDPPEPGPGFVNELVRALDLTDWSRLAEEARALHEATASLRYVALTQYSLLSPASINAGGDTYDPGSAWYDTSVVSFSDGAVVCAGSGKGSLNGELIGTGRADNKIDAATKARDELEKDLLAAWAEAALGAPLKDVCAAGGPVLCENAENLAVAIDW